MKMCRITLSVMWVLPIFYDDQQSHRTRVETIICVVEDESVQLPLRAAAVDDLAKMSARTASPRLLNVLLKNRSYADSLSFSILVYLEKLPSPNAVPFLLKYEAFARQNGFRMAGKIRGALKRALDACRVAK